MEGKSLVDALSYEESDKDLVLQHYFPTLHYLASQIYSLLGARIRNRRPMETYVLNSIKYEASDSLAPFSPFTVAHELRTHPDALDLYAIASECLDHLGAGVETTGDTLTSLLHALSLPSNAASGKPPLRTYPTQSGGRR
ncbi:Cytochrome P450 [Macrophomina phaseolina MS6]|uniref:Cytochrome P450 n=1 Tax=Macrophomina phaseolina (strain MS6) TaxID=1126212 RepID=K2S9U0_MACPH|nr:Cytochrome P450 [Macrophomina phaseolina MS6]